MQVLLHLSANVIFYIYRTPGPLLSYMHIYILNSNYCHAIVLQLSSGYTVIVHVQTQLLPSCMCMHCSVHGLNTYMNRQLYCAWFSIPFSFS